MTDDEIQVLNKQRIHENNRQKAEEFKAQTEADAENGWNIFLARHSGQLAIARGDVFPANQANVGLLDEWLAEQGVLVTADALERALTACRSRLSPFHQADYARKTDTLTSRIAPQPRTFAPATVRAPYTRAEILSWSASRLRLETRRFGNEEIDRILRGE